MDALRSFQITYTLEGGYAPPWRSGSASQWQADTIFGKLCWTYLYRQGEKALKEFLSRYENGDPPIVISNGFPAGYLPRPLTVPSAFPAGLSIEEQRKQAEVEKEQQKLEMLTIGEFESVICGESIQPVDIMKRREIVHSSSRLRSSINRLSGTTSGPDDEEESAGALFETAVSFTKSIRIYAKIAPDFIDEARELFQDFKYAGPGKCVSTGMSAVDLGEYWFEEFQGFRCPENPNGFVALSNFVPSRQDPTQGLWKVMIKYGKFGDVRANSAPASSSSTQPFKKPVLMFEAGSVFLDSNIREWYGRLVKGISDHYMDARQYGICYAVPCVTDYR